VFVVAGCGATKVVVVDEVVEVVVDGAAVVVLTPGARVVVVGLSVTPGCDVPPPPTVPSATASVARRRATATRTKNSFRLPVMGSDH
jgi:hypothetical protein